MYITDMTWRGSGLTVTDNGGRVYEAVIKLKDGSFVIEGVPDWIVDDLLATRRDRSYEAIYGGLGGTLNLQEEKFIPFGGQTIFTLTDTYRPGGFVLLDVNGVKYERGPDYQIFGNVVIWYNLFTLNAQDELSIIYERF